MPEKRRLNIHAFERAEQLVSYVSCLRQMVLPLKFAYLGEAAHTHDALVRSREYGLTDTEATLLRAKFGERILPKISSEGINIFDIGSGNGLKAVIILSLLEGKVAHVTYTALDYSDELLRIAADNICNKFNRLEVSTYQVDFESETFAKIVHLRHENTGHRAMLMLLGHTLGNPADRQGALHNVRESMFNGDLLLLGVELYQAGRVSHVLEHYENEVFLEAVFCPLTFAGLNRQDGTLSIIFNEATKDVEVYFTLRSDLTIEIDSDAPIRYKKGDRLSIFLSHRFDEGEVLDALSIEGLDVIDTVLDEENAFLLVLARCRAERQEH